MIMLQMNTICEGPNRRSVHVVANKSADNTDNVRLRSTRCARYITRTLLLLVTCHLHLFVLMREWMTITSVP